MRLIIFLIIHITFLNGVYAQETNSSAIKSVDPEEFQILMHLHDYFLLIDVRSRMEYRISRIPGAILAESRSILHDLTDTLDRETPLLLYCTTDTRSSASAKKLAEQGFINIFVLEPGILGWKSAGKEVDRRRIKRKNIFFY